MLSRLLDKSGAYGSPTPGVAAGSNTTMRLPPLNGLFSNNMPNCARNDVAVDPPPTNANSTVALLTFLFIRPVLVVVRPPALSSTQKTPFNGSVSPGYALHHPPPK